jgi:hypothetical protein
MNEYLLDKPINLPERLTPMVAVPEINIISTQEGKYVY